MKTKLLILFLLIGIAAKSQNKLSVDGSFATMISSTNDTLWSYAITGFSVSGTANPLFTVGAHNARATFYASTISTLNVNSVNTDVTSSAILQALFANKTSGGGGGGAAATTSTVANTNTTTTGTVAAGAKMIMVLNNGTANGTFNGAIIKPNESINYPQIANATYPAISYNATGTNFLIVRIN